MPPKVTFCFWLCWPARAVSLDTKTFFNEGRKKGYAVGLIKKDDTFTLKHNFISDIKSQMPKSTDVSSEQSSVYLRFIY